MTSCFAIGRDWKTACELRVCVWWVPLQPSHPVVWALWILALSMAGIWDQWMDRTRTLLALQVAL